MPSTQPPVPFRRGDLLLAGGEEERGKLVDADKGKSEVLLAPRTRKGGKGLLVSVVGDNSHDDGDDDDCDDKIDINLSELDLGHAGDAGLDTSNGNDYGSSRSRRITPSDTLSRPVKSPLIVEQKDIRSKGDASEYQLHPLAAPATSRSKRTGVHVDGLAAVMELLATLFSNKDSHSFMRRYVAAVTCLVLPLASGSAAGAKKGTVN